MTYSYDELLLLVKDYVKTLERRDREVLHLRGELERERQTSGERLDALQQMERRVEEAESELMRLQRELSEEVDD